ncbi:MAG: hypothetical protein COA78_15150 [Blastopirellula sp.]|nr:MAG: hypothetical protein COA78_15150 [Blastopirellula sp.]
MTFYRLLTLKRRLFNQGSIRCIIEMKLISLGLKMNFGLLRRIRFIIKLKWNIQSLLFHQANMEDIVY